MKILLVCQCFYPENFRVNDLTAELVRRGHQVTVLTGTPMNRTTGRAFEGYERGKRNVDEYQGAKVLRVDTADRKSGSKALVRHYLSFWRQGNKFAKKLAKQEKFDIVLVYQLSPVFMAFPGITLAKKQHIPLITYTLDLWPESVIYAGGVDFGPAVKWLTAEVKKIYDASSRILVSTRNFTDKIKKLGQPEEKIEYFPQYAEDCYVPLPRDPEDPIDRELPDGFRITFTGNIGTSQTLGTVAEAAAILKARGVTDIKWIIVGDGRDREAVDAKVKETDTGDMVYFTGRRPMEEMSRFMAASDAALLILKDEELFNITLPAKVQSYMACGKPILACIKGAGAETVAEAGCGVVTDAISGEALAEAALKLRNLPKEELEKMGEAAVIYSGEKFSRDKLITRLEEIMRELT